MTSSSSTSSSTSINRSSTLIPGKTRIRDVDGFVGTIQYIGPVASAKNQTQLYAGIEWDDDTRGKHDGSVVCRQTNALVRHFSCVNSNSNSGTAGSFIKLEKVTLGRELDLSVVKERYVDANAPLVAPNNILPYSARTSSGRDKPIEFWGEESVRNLQQYSELTDIALRSMGISKLSQNGMDELVDTLGHLTELDLAGNLFSEWEHVLEIWRAFPHLTWISLVSNRILDLSPKFLKVPVGEFNKIQVLNLNKCGISSFDTLLQLDQMCPNLQELCVGYSDLSDLHKEEHFHDTNAENDNDNDNDVVALSGFKHLKLLDCSSCKLSSWNHQVRKLRDLPQLETLILSDNPLSNITYQTHSDTPEFAFLSHLQLAGTSISTWGDLEALSTFPQLKSLRFRNCPLTNQIGTGEARAGTIARLPQLTSVNASPISMKERMEAERRYVGSVARELILLTTQYKVQSTQLGAAGGDGEQALTTSKTTTKTDHDAELERHKQKLYRQYPQFEQLMAIHKESMMVSQASSLGAGTISETAVNVMIRSMSSESCTMDPIQKRLPGNLKISRLKNICRKRFGLNVELQLLHFRAEGDAFPTELDDDENTLSYYGVTDGAEILMNEIDLQAKEREEKRAIEIHNKRIEEQEMDSNALQALQKSEMRAHSIAAEHASSRIYAEERK